MPYFSLEEKIRRCAGRHPDWPAWRIAKTVGTTKAEVDRVLEGKENVTPPVSPENCYVSIEKIRMKYDIKSAIYRELSNIPRGKLISEAELCFRTAGTDRARFRRVVENNEEEFRRFRIKLRLDDGEPKWFWGHPDDIAEAIRIRDL